MALTQVSDAGLKTPASDLQDNEKIILGTGNDLEVYHDATNSVIDNNTGNLYINSTGDIYLCPKDSEAGVYVRADGAVELYHNNVKKFQTTANGTHCFGQLEMDGNNNIDLQDNGALLLGTSDDLQIYHNGSNSKIDNTTGTLYIQGDVISLAGAGGSENLAVFNKDGAVELYYNNSKKLDTLNGGVQVHGNLYQHDNSKAVYGTGDDLSIYHDGTHSYIENTNGSLKFAAGQVEINKSTSETMAKFVPDAQVELYYDNSKKFETTAGGVQVTGNIETNAHISLTADNKRLKFGGGEDLQIYHDGTDTYFRNETTGAVYHKARTGWYLGTNATSGGSDKAIHALQNGAVELYYDDSKKFETTSGGVDVTGTMVCDGITNSSTSWFQGHADMNDSVKFRWGTGQDLEIYHDGSHSYIKNTTGNLYVNSGALLVTNAADNEFVAKFTADGACELYHDNSKKFETTSSGATITGNAVASSKFRGNDDVKLSLGDGEDLQLWHSGTDTFIKNNTNTLFIDSADEIQLRNTSTEKYIKCINNGAVELYYDNAKQVQTISSGLNWQDNKKAEFGNSGDLQIYHDGGGSYVANSTGILMIQGKSGENSIRCHPDAQVELYHNNSIKLATTSSGCTVTGSVSETSDIALKTNIEPIDNVLDKIQQITGYTYQFKDTGSNSMGVTAQDVEKVFPELVHGEEGTKTLQYSGLIGALVESVKELSNKVAALEAK